MMIKILKMIGVLLLSLVFFFIAGNDIYACGGETPKEIEINISGGI